MPPSAPPGPPPTGQPARQPPPAGGFGGAPGHPGQQQHYGPQTGPHPQTGGSGAGTAVIIVVVVLAGLVFGLGILGVLGLYGVRKYIANAKTAEARSALGLIGKDAAIAYEGDSLSEPAAATQKRLCPSAAPVPTAFASVSGKKYMSSASDWTSDPGWSCLKFEMATPQYYQYRYEGSGSGFKATAEGDLNADGVRSRFELEGRLESGRVRVAPTILESNPEE